MVNINKMFHIDGKIVFEDAENRWFELQCIVNDLVVDTYGTVLAHRIEDPTK